MNKEAIVEYILDEYKVSQEHPWMKYPENIIFRQKKNKKWFAFITNIPKTSLGIEVKDRIDIINVKCDPELIGSLIESEGFYPAYHMNKTHWITMVLDGSISDDKIKWLIDISFQLTKK